MGGKPRLGVVSYLAHHPYEPRGVRTRAIIDALAGDWEIELVAGPSEKAMRSDSWLLRGARYARYEAFRAVALDRTEIWSRTILSKWKADIDAAVLIGFPFAPVALGGRRLAARGIPFIVDASDPWALTADRAVTRASNGMWPIAFHRACAAERRMWEHAAGAIVTTSQQARALNDLFPHLRTLVSPNGFRDDTVGVVGTRAEATGELRIGHFGNIYAPRVDMAQFFACLTRASRWDAVVLEQFGGDWNRTLRRMPPGVKVRTRAPVPWERVISLSYGLDVALVVGNVGGIQLPSKVIDYLTLPIPRVALVDRPEDDAISDYLRDKRGWLILGKDDPEAADRLADHLDKEWSAEDLAPPASESWTAMGQQLAAFTTECLGEAKGSAEDPTLPVPHPSRIV